MIFFHLPFLFYSISIFINTIIIIIIPISGQNCPCHMSISSRFDFIQTNQIFKLLLFVAIIMKGFNATFLIF